MRVPEGWKVKTISNILDKVSRPVEVAEKDLYREIGIRSHGKGIFYKEPISGAQLGKKRVFHIEPNCLVINIVFAWEQAVAKTTDAEIGMIASHRFPMFAPKNGECDIDFIHYLFKTRHGKYLLELASPGGAGRNKTLGQSEFAKLELLLPPTIEQQKIAKILSTWDKAITTTEQLLTNSQQQKKALMQQLLTGKKRLLDEHGVRFDGEWKVKKLGSISEMNSGGTPKSSVAEYFDGGIPWVSIADITKYGKRISKTEKTLSPQGLENSSARMYPKNTILFAMYASIGECSIAEIEVCSSQAILGIRPKDELDYEYLYFYLSSLKDEIKLQGQQGTQSNLNAAMVKSFKIPLPNIEEQKAISLVLNLGDRDIERLQTQLEALKQEKKALMQQLLTGKRRVKVEVNYEHH